MKLPVTAAFLLVFLLCPKESISAPLLSGGVGGLLGSVAGGLTGGVPSLPVAVPAAASTGQGLLPVLGEALNGLTGALAGPAAAPMAVPAAVPLASGAMPAVPVLGAVATVPVGRKKRSLVPVAPKLAETLGNGASGLTSGVPDLGGLLSQLPATPEAMNTLGGALANLAGGLLGGAASGKPGGVEGLLGSLTGALTGGAARKKRSLLPGVPVVMPAVPAPSGVLPEVGELAANVLNTASGALQGLTSGLTGALTGGDPAKTVLAAVPLASGAGPAVPLTSGVASALSTLPVAGSMPAGLGGVLGK